MRISREYFFDLTELVGKAITTARKKRAGPAWDMDTQIAGFMRRHDIDAEKLDRAIREEARKEDDRFNLFQDSSWKDSAPDSHEGTLEERDARESYSKFESEAFEQKRAQRNYDGYGDSVSCRLWELMRQVRFKETRVVDAIRDLQSLCNDLSGYISAGWGHRLAQIIDQSSP